MVRRFSKNDRVLALMGVLFVLSFVVGGAIYAVNIVQVADIDRVRIRLDTLRAGENALSDAVRDQEAALDDFVLSRSQVALERYELAVARESTLDAELVDELADLPDVAAAFAGLRSTSLTWQMEVASPTISAARSGAETLLIRFAADSADDHREVRTAISEIDLELGHEADNLVVLEASVATTTTVGTALAFAFLAVAFGVAMYAVRRFGHALEIDADRSRVFNRFTELTTFAGDDRAVAVANLTALARLTSPDGAVTHILNRSLDRAVPEASSGTAMAEGPAPPWSRSLLGRDPGHGLSDDLSDELTVHCPVYPATSGTLACIPLASGETVGSVHLYWRRPWSLPLELRPTIARITEHAALAIGNRRLMSALYGQANTDPRTGLANSRAFDVALEEALTVRTGTNTVSVLMIDVDNFKQFNDRHGHPAGDEALRTFGAVLRSCMREGDLAARYGGEEFAVLVPGENADGVLSIAERIRSRTEETLIALAAGITDHITVSIGVASAPDHAQDRVTLLRLADEALYRAKEGGRNRVVAISERSDQAPRERRAPARPMAQLPRPLVETAPLIADAVVLVDRAIEA